MLAYRDASMGLGAVSREERSTYDDNRYMNNRHQHELDEVETSKARQCLKKTTKFLFAHIGLVGLVVVYAVAGGFLFQLLEEHQEKVNCQEAQGEQIAEQTQFKQQVVSYIQLNTTSVMNSTTKDNTTIAFAKIGAMLYNYRQFVIGTSSKYRYYNDDCSVINKWTYPNSLLFAITIITTIGYGNITPVTWQGQLCCICYATIGIPILLLCVANISGVLGELFRFVYAKIICKPCSIIKKRHKLARRETFAEETGMNSGRPHPIGWTSDDENRKGSIKKATNVLSADNYGDEGELRRNQRVAVPLTVTMIIIAAYIWIGSVLFHNFEGWTMIQSGYFCFITLSTIGFGDFVPGQRKDDPNAGAKLILGAVYVLFGMAILAMCFDLMQEELVAKFRWIGRKIGVVDKDEEEGNDNQADQGSDIKNHKKDSLTNDPNGGMNTTRTILDDENGWPTQRGSSGTRKASPRNNTARVHPVGTDTSNDGILHQRVPTSKQNKI